MEVGWRWDDFLVGCLKMGYPFRGGTSVCHPSNADDVEIRLSCVDYTKAIQINVIITKN